MNPNSNPNPTLTITLTLTPTPTPTLTPNQQTKVSYDRSLGPEDPSCPSLPLPLHRTPTPAAPLIFFHLRDVNGTKLREVLMRAGQALKLSYFIPCFAGQPGSWLELLSSDKPLGVRRRCNTYNIDGLLERPQEQPSTSTFMQAAPSLYAGHLPYHVSTQFGAAYMGGRAFQKRTSDGQQFSCILAVREPVARFQTCYQERLSAGMGGRPLKNLSSPERVGGNTFGMRLE